MRNRPSDHFGLDGHQQDFQFATAAGTQNLIIPHHLRERKRHVLLRFVLDDLRHLARVHRRELDEFGKHLKTRRADVDVPRPWCRFPPAPRARLWKHGSLRGKIPWAALEAERLDGKIFETQTAGFVDFKLRQLEAARPKSTARNDFVFSISVRAARRHQRHQTVRFWV